MWTLLPRKLHRDLAKTSRHVPPVSVGFPNDRRSLAHGLRRLRDDAFVLLGRRSEVEAMAHACWFERWVVTVAVAWPFVAVAWLFVVVAWLCCCRGVAFCGRGVAFCGRGAAFGGRASWLKSAAQKCQVRNSIKRHRKTESTATNIEQPAVAFLSRRQACS